MVFYEKLSNNLYLLKVAVLRFIAFCEIYFLSADAPCLSPSFPPYYIPILINNL